ncbi:MAG: Lrp/AsnC family transcriptional regulator [Desulfotomaculaceae bacterium]|nr:Lrp/AsnC family transcriptional regulator [Desulfotomaculaceae bacterium]
MLSEQDKQIVRAVQNGLPLTSRPFRAIAEQLELSEEELLAIIRGMCESGWIRRFGAVVRHRELGFVANAMVVWNVPEELVEVKGKIMAGFSEVSHCYQRPRRSGWPYNLFTVIHGQSREYCKKVTDKISKATGLTDYRLLFSTTELKKSNMCYFE